MNKGAACAKGSRVSSAVQPQPHQAPMKRIESAAQRMGASPGNSHQRDRDDVGVLPEGGPAFAVHGRRRQPAVLQPGALFRVGRRQDSPGWRSATCRATTEFGLNGTADTSLADGPVTEVPPRHPPDDKCTPTKTYVMWGAGPSYHGIGSTGRVVTDLRNAGMKTVIDPRSRPMPRADVWLAIRPGTDVALMLA
ncbi:MAG: hypothetical protein ACLSVD_02210 [Eggerthellaceae bacterium]